MTWGTNPPLPPLTSLTSTPAPKQQAPHFAPLPFHGGASNHTCEYMGSKPLLHGSSHHFPSHKHPHMHRVMPSYFCAPPFLVKNWAKFRKMAHGHGEKVGFFGVLFHLSMPPWQGHGHIGGAPTPHACGWGPPSQKGGGILMPWHGEHEEVRGCSPHHVLL